MIHLKGEENMVFMHPEPASLVEVMLQISEFVMIMNLHVKMPSCMKLEIKKNDSFTFPASCMQLLVIIGKKHRRVNLHPHRLLGVNKDFKNLSC